VWHKANLRPLVTHFREVMSAGPACH